MGINGAGVFDNPRELCSKATGMHDINIVLIVQMYTDASKFAVGCHISQLQYKSEEPAREKFPVSILFDSIKLCPVQRNYITYKRELLASIELTRKYSYMFPPWDPSIIYTDHRPLTYFLKTTQAEGIYAR
ncbi:hypothetical protein K3495_g13148 [Podosphaera aphanis]|nr:hypothetical protein K3495_g13148 [Podosphaera aphanis]